MSLASRSFAMAVRRLCGKPMFALVAVLTLGANTAMFSVVYGVLLKPLPFDEPGRLVSVWSTAPARVPRGSSLPLAALLNASPGVNHGHFYA